MTLFAIYAGCLVLGGILIAASMFGAGKDAEGDTGHDGSGGHDLDTGPELEAGHDVEAGHEIEAQGSHDKDLAHDHQGLNSVAATLLSLRFWTFALAAFGMTGLLLTPLPIGPLPALALSIVTGVGIGVGVSTLLRVISRDTVSSALDARTLRGRDAEVVLTMGPDKLGKVRLIHNGQSIELPATTKEGRILERGERVLVVDVSGGTAEVTPVAPDRRSPTALPTQS